MKTKLLLPALLVVSAAAFGQSNQQRLLRAIECFNRFQQHQMAGKQDSAFLAVQELSTLDTDLLNDLLHNFFAQGFKKTEAAELDGWLLDKFTAGSPNLRVNVAPLAAWVAVWKRIGEKKEVVNQVEGLLRQQSDAPEERANRIDRYALLIYKTLRERPEYQALADTLFDRTRQRLEHAVNGQYYQAMFDGHRQAYANRAYFRYLMAYSYYLKAKEAQTAQHVTLADSLYRLSSQFSPDEHDQMAQHSYSYDAFMLADGQPIKNFHEPHFQYLLTKKDTAAALKVLTDLTLTDPSNIDILKDHYARFSRSGVPFRQYWNRVVNARLKPAEPFKLTTLDGKTLDFGQMKGKWVLIDFWGTWCVPCVKEMPAFQKVYNDLVNKPDSVVVFTAACHDTEERVRTFMTKNNYTFPVAMVNEAFIRQFRVGGYPTKVLITPEGNRMRIPHEANWEKRVRTYLEN